MLLLGLNIVLYFSLYSQNTMSFQKEIEAFRLKYKNDFLTDDNSPLSKKDTAFLRFFSPNEKFKLKAKFSKIENSTPFEMATYSGKTKTFIKYGKLDFKIDSIDLSLFVYRNLKLAETKEYKDYLFIPFKDLTCGEESYGGGRYIDILVQDILADNTLTLDFNKCYNPYCAFSSGYNCPIPPKENWLELSVKAGEKQFGKSH